METSTTTTYLLLQSICILLRIKQGHKKDLAHLILLPTAKNKNKKSMKISTITTYSLFTVAVQYYEDQTIALIRSCAPYYHTSCNQ